MIEITSTGYLEKDIEDAVMPNLEKILSLKVYWQYEFICATWSVGLLSETLGYLRFSPMSHHPVSSKHNQIDYNNNNKTPTHWAFLTNRNFDFSPANNIVCNLLGQHVYV
jgi:hypothetical protein